MSHLGPSVGLPPLSWHAGPSCSNLSFLSAVIPSPAPGPASHTAPGPVPGPASHAVASPAPSPAPGLQEAGSHPEHVPTSLSLLPSCGPLWPEQLPQLLFRANASPGLKAQVSPHLCTACPNCHGAGLGILSSAFRQLFVITASREMQKMQHVSHRKVLAASAVPGTMQILGQQRPNAVPTPKT